MIRLLTVGEILAYHRRLMTLHGQASTVIAQDKLESAVARPSTTAFGEEMCPTIAEKAAVLLQSIVIGHPFEDGNKRAGAGAMLAFLELNGVDMPR